MENIKEDGINFTLRSVISFTEKCFPDVKTISTDDIEKKLTNASDDPKILLIDNRERQEYEVSHIQDAKFVDFKKPHREQFQQLLAHINDHIKENENSDKNVPVYVYCAVVFRASWLVSYAQQRLEKMRIKEGSSVDPVQFHKFSDNILQRSVQLSNVKGSIFKWAYEHKPLVDINNKSTDVVHPCSTVWGKVILDGELRSDCPCRFFI